jgi:hypothetical protein
MANREPTRGDVRNLKKKEKQITQTIKQINRMVFHLSVALRVIYSLVDGYIGSIKMLDELTDEPTTETLRPLLLGIGIDFQKK